MLPIILPYLSFSFSHTDAEPSQSESFFLCKPANNLVFSFRTGLELIWGSNREKIGCFHTTCVRTCTHSHTCIFHTACFLNPSSIFVILDLFTCCSCFACAIVKTPTFQPVLWPLTFFFKGNLTLLSKLTCELEGHFTTVLLWARTVYIASRLMTSTCLATWVFCCLWFKGFVCGFACAHHWIGGWGGGSRVCLIPLAEAWA